MQQPEENEIQVAHDSDGGDEDDKEKQSSSDEQEESDPNAKTMSKEEAQEKYKLARTAVKDGKLDEALSIFEELVKHFIKLYGDSSAELADLYYRLGKVYLSVGKKAADSLYTGMVKKKLTNDKPSNPSFHFEGDESSSDEKDEAGSADQLLDSAWKALEYARVIYEERKSNPIELSDVHLALGEFCQEMEQPKEETLGEYKKVLELRKELPDDTPETPSATSKDRLIAEAYYEFALTHLFYAEQQEAIEHFTNAAQTLRKRMQTLQNGAAEMEELQAIVADIDDRVNELKSLPPPPPAAAAAAAATAPSTPRAATSTSSSSSSATAAQPSPAAPVNVIQHLVRQKRPNDTTAAAPPAKMPATETTASTDKPTMEKKNE